MRRFSQSRGRHVRRLGHGRRTAQLTVIAVLTSLTALWLPTSPASAACDLVPQLRDVAVNQGQAQYTPLVRGKTTIVKTYLSLPSCAVTGDSIAITSATVDVTLAGGVLNTVRADVTGPPYAQLLPVSATPAPDAPADALFQVPGTAMLPADGGLDRSTATFSVTVGYTATPAGGTATSSTTTLLSSTGGPTAIATLERSTNATRLLVVPFGDPRGKFLDWWPTVADDALLKALQAYGRIMPVRDGVGALNSTAGVRFSRAPTLLDVSGYLVSKKFCGNGGNFPDIQTKLGQFLQNWNAANPTTPVDKVVGVAWQGASTGPDTNTSCADGYAAIGGNQAWTRIVADNTTTSPATYGRGGPLLAMEVGHTFGSVPAERDNPADTFHSVADSGSGDRGINTLTRKVLQNAPSALKYQLGASARFDDYSTLLRQEDWQYTLCVLTPPSATAPTACPATKQGSVGAAASLAEAYVLAGTTDGTPSRTDAHSYNAPSVDTTSPEPASTYRLIQRNSSEQVLANDGVPVTFTMSNHDGSASHDVNSTLGTFDVAVQRAGAADRFELWKGNPVTSPSAAVRLYRRVKDGSPAFVAGAVRPSIGTLVNRTAAVSGGSSPALSPSGDAVAYTSPSGVVVLDLASGQRSAAAAGTADGAWFPSGDQLVVVENGGNLATYTVTRNAGGAPSLTRAGTVYDRSQQVTLLDKPAGRAAVSPDASYLVTSISGGLVRITLPSPLPAGGVVCRLESLGLSPCRTLTSGGSDADPAFSGADTLLFTRGTSVGQYDLSSSTVTATTLPSAKQPAVDGGLAAVTGATGIDVVDAQTLGLRTPLTTGADAHPSLAGPKLAFDRTSSGRTDVYTTAMESSTFAFTATDDHPELLRADLYIACGGFTQPIVVAARATSTTATSASWQIPYDGTGACAGGTVTLRVTDGYSSVITTLGTVSGSDDGAWSVYSPAAGATYLQYESVELQAGSSGGEGAPGGLSYRITGPSGTSTVPYSANGTSALPPAAGWTPGTHTVQLLRDGAVVATSSFVAVGDADHDGMTDAQEQASCFPAGAGNDPTNAGKDYDGDGIANVSDPAPCTSASNVTVDFDANSLNSGSNGNTVTLYVTRSPIALTSFSAANVAITSMAGYTTDFHAVSWTVSGTTATAKFDRQAFMAFATSKNLHGYIPTVLSATSSSGSIRGLDPRDPTFS